MQVFIEQANSCEPEKVLSFMHRVVNEKLPIKVKKVDGKYVFYDPNEKQQHVEIPHSLEEEKLPKVDISQLTPPPKKEEDKKPSNVGISRLAPLSKNKKILDDDGFKEVVYRKKKVHKVEQKKKEDTDLTSVISEESDDQQEKDESFGLGSNAIYAAMMASSRGRQCNDAWGDED